MAGDAALATIALVVVSASLPFYLAGAWVILRVEVVTWRVLTRHLALISVGLALTTGPVLGWMLPRFPETFDGFVALHAFLGVQAYALLAFALTGIVPIVRAKRARDLYHDPDPSVSLDDLHANAPAWRRRLRSGVFGYLGLWLLAWVVGLARYWLRYGG